MAKALILFLNGKIFISDRAVSLVLNARSLIAVFVHILFTVYESIVLHKQVGYSCCCFLNFLSALCDPRLLLINRTRFCYTGADRAGKLTLQVRDL